MFKTNLTIHSNGTLTATETDYEVSDFVDFVVKNLNDSTASDECVKDTIQTYLTLGVENTSELIYTGNALKAMKDHLSAIEAVITNWAADTGEEGGMDWEDFSFADVFYKAFNRVVYKIADMLDLLE